MIEHDTTGVKMIIPEMVEEEEKDGEEEAIP